MDCRVGVVLQLLVIDFRNPQQRVRVLGMLLQDALQQPDRLLMLAFEDGVLRPFIGSLAGRTVAHITHLLAEPQVEQVPEVLRHEVAQAQHRHGKAHAVAQQMHIEPRHATAGSALDRIVASLTSSRVFQCRARGGSQVGSGSDVGEDRWCVAGREVCWGVGACGGGGLLAAAGAAQILRVVVHQQGVVAIGVEAAEVARRKQGEIQDAFQDGTHGQLCCGWATG